jgi:hypothetical protein
MAALWEFIDGRGLGGGVVGEGQVHRRNLAVAQERGLGHADRGLELADKLVADAADVDR